MYIYICIYIYIAAFLFCNAAVSLPVVLKSICGADECHQISVVLMSTSGAEEYLQHHDWGSGFIYNPM